MSYTKSFPVDVTWFRNTTWHEFLHLFSFWDFDVFDVFLFGEILPKSHVPYATPGQKKIWSRPSHQEVGPNKGVLKLTTSICNISWSAVIYWVPTYLSHSKCQLEERRCCHSLMHLKFKFDSTYFLLAHDVNGIDTWIHPIFENNSQTRSMLDS